MYTPYQPMTEGVDFYLERAIASERVHRVHFPLLIVCAGKVLLRDMSTVDAVFADPTIKGDEKNAIALPQQQRRKLGRATRFERTIRNFVSNEVLTNKLTPNMLNIEPLGLVKSFSSDHEGVQHTTVTQIPTIVGIKATEPIEPHRDFRFFNGQTFWEEPMVAFDFLTTHAEMNPTSNLTMDALDAVEALARRTNPEHFIQIDSTREVA